MSSEQYADYCTDIATQTCLQSTLWMQSQHAMTIVARHMHVRMT